MSRSKSYVLYIYILVFTTILISWFPNLLRCELNFDESQWVAQANNLNAAPSLWFEYFLPTNYSRILTILPLAAFGKITGKLDYIDVRIYTIILWSLFISILYLFLYNIMNKKTALITLCIITLNVSLFYDSDFVAYNSELPAILLSMIALFLFHKSNISNNLRVCCIVLGLITSFIPFAKEQMLPVALSMNFMFLIYYIANKSFIRLYYMLIGNILGMIVMLGPYFLFNNIHSLLYNIQITREYSGNGLFNNIPSFGNHVYNLIFAINDGELKTLSLLPIVLFPFALLLSKYNKHLLDSTYKRTVFLHLSIFIVTCFSVAYPVDYFSHYALLLVFPGSILLSHIVFLVTNKATGEIFTVFSITVFIFLLSINSILRYNTMSPSSYYSTKNQFAEYIINNSNETDRLMIWGWANYYFVQTGLSQGSRYMYPHFIIAGYKESDAAIDLYIQDLEFLQPKYIIECVGKGNFLFTDKEKQSIKNFNKLYTYVTNHYDLMQTTEAQILYRRIQ